jgi:ankyrin repeat protein
MFRTIFPLFALLCVSAFASSDTSPDERLVQALLFNNARGVEAALAAGANPDLRDERIGTPLITALATNQPESASLLLDHHADVNLTTSSYPPLFNAGWNNLVDLMKRMISLGAKVNYELPKGRTLVSALAERNVTEPVRLLVDAGAKVDIHEENYQSSTPLLYASQAGNGELIRILLAHGANAKDVQTDGTTALIFAVKAGSRGGVAALVKAGAELERKDELSRTALGYSVSSLYHPDFEIVLALVEAGANVNAENSNGESVLFLASSGSDTRIVGLLIDQGADVNARDNYKQTPLMEAARAGGSIDMIELLLKHGAEINARSAGNTTALIWAAHSRNEDAGIYLINHGADVNVAENAHGATALIYAAAYSRNALAFTLIDRDADVNAKLDSDNSPLYFAKYYSNCPLIRKLLERGAVDPLQGPMPACPAQAG